MNDTTIIQLKNELRRRKLKTISITTSSGSNGPGRPKRRNYEFDDESGNERGDYVMSRFVTADI